MPNRDDFIRITKSIAMLDAIMCPEWEDRYYAFDGKWGSGEQMASMRDGSGDEWKAHVTDAGIILFGLAHESAMFRHGNPWPGILDDVPAVFDASIAEPAFDTANLSFCLWLLADSATWQRGDVAFPDTDSSDADGSIELLAILDGKPSTYRAWAEDYYEMDIDLAAVEAIYRGEPLTPERVSALNADIRLDDLGEDIEGIGYP